MDMVYTIPSSNFGTNVFWMRKQFSVHWWEILLSCGIEWLVILTVPLYACLYVCILANFTFTVSIHDTFSIAFFICTFFGWSLSSRYEGWALLKPDHDLDSVVQINPPGARGGQHGASQNKPCETWHEACVSAINMLEVSSCRQVWSIAVH